MLWVFNQLSGYSLLLLVAWILYQFLRFRRLIELVRHLGALTVFWNLGNTCTFSFIICLIPWIGRTIKQVHQVANKLLETLLMPTEILFFHGTSTGPAVCGAKTCRTSQSRRCEQNYNKWDISRRIKVFLWLWSAVVHHMETGVAN